MGAALRRFTPSKINLETSSIVWLDGSVNTLQESIDAKQRLRLVINNLEAFENIDLCEEYIKSLSEIDQIVLIVSGALGQKIVPRIHQFRQIVSIYVYCGNKQRNEAWIKDFPKVRGVAVQLDELIGQIRSDQVKQQHNKTNEPLTFTTFNANEQQTVGLNGQFVHSQLLIDCLLQMKSNTADVDEFISLCKQEYHGNEEQLAIVQKFKSKYSSNQAVYWYTSDSFLYRILNKALRAQNIHLLFLFRFLIRDIEKQLKDNQCSSRLTVYRGQLMWIEEFETLKQSVGQLISMNSFLSTSLDRELALSFLPDSKNLERVLFEIDANPQLPGIKPFAHIKSLSAFPDENEVLFMLGSIFRLVSIIHDRNGVWTVKLTLCGDRDHDLKTIFDDMKSQDKQGELDLVILGDVLGRMGKYDEAETYYNRCLRELKSDDHHNISACYYALGRSAESKGDCDRSLEWLHKSLKIDMKILKPDDPNIANTHNLIGNVYQAKCDNERSLESYSKALTIFRRALGDDHLNVAMCLNNMGAVHQQLKKYSKALDYYQDAIAIRKNRLSTNHPDLGALHNNLGIVHRHLGHPDQALEHYNHALKIYQVSLPPQHPDIALTLENIGIVHEEKRDWNQALSYYKKADAMYRKAFSSTNGHVIQIEKSIQRVSSKLK